MVCSIRRYLGTGLILPAEDRLHTVAGRLKQSCGLHAERTAIVSPGETLNYAQLWRRVSRLADALRTAGGTSPTRVALLFEQGSEALVGTLAAAVAGHCYVPLDANDPAERVQLILNACQAELLLHGSNLRQLVSQLKPNHCRQLTLEELAASHIPRRRKPTRFPVSDDLLYIFYTSGSTGRPKGVCQTNRNLLHFVDRYSETLSITEQDRLSLLYSLSFSAANMDIYGALLRGAALHLYDIRKKGLPGLPVWLNAQRISVLHTVPSVMRQLLALPGVRDRLDSIRIVDLGGEPLYNADAQAFQNAFPHDCRLINHLAATEASVIAQYEVPKAFSLDTLVLPVGGPASGIEVLIFDENGQEQAQGTSGDIVLRSEYLSPGYWAQPELSESVFFKDTADPAHRCYRTGDRGWMSHQGVLHVTGRNNDRVKIRGHSVELAEVEAALSSLGDTTEVAVAAMERQHGGTELHACVVGHPRSQADVEDWRKQLSSKLPSYMVPTRIHLLERLPRTASGKIDRKAVRAAINTEAVAIAPEKAPQDKLEAQISRCMCEVLQRAQIPPDRSFFDLGGDSLKLAELHVLLKELLGHAPDPRILIMQSSVNALLHWYRSSALRVAPAQRIAALNRTGAKPPLFLVHGLAGFAFITPDFLAVLGEDQPVYALQAKGLDGKVAPSVSVRSMAMDYLALVREQYPKGPLLLGGICSGGLIALEMACIEEQRGIGVPALLLIDPPPDLGLRFGLRRIKNALAGASDLLVLRWFKGAGSSSSTGMIKVRDRLSKRWSFNQLAIDLKDRGTFVAARQVRAWTRISLALHRSCAFSGTARVLCSEKRASQRTVASLLTGDSELFILPGTHKNALDARRTEFSKALNESMRALLTALPDIEDAPLG